MQHLIEFLFVSSALAVGHSLETAGGKTVREIVIVPIGLQGGQSLEFLRKGIARMLCADCRVGARVPLPAAAYNKKRRQYLSTDLIREIEAAPEGRGAMRIGVADVDMYVSSLNFVFGEAHPRGGSCIISLYRLRNELYGMPSDRGIFEKRALTEAVHELGHVLELGHCADSHCVMYFSNSLPDTDRKGAAFCDSCRQRSGVYR